MSSPNSGRPARLLDPNLEQTFAETSMLIPDSLGAIPMPRRVLDPHLEQTMADYTMMIEQSFSAETENKENKVLDVSDGFKKPFKVLDPNLEQTMADCTIFGDGGSVSNFDISVTKTPIRVLDPQMEKTFSVGCDSDSYVMDCFEAKIPARVLDPHLEQTMVETTMVDDSDSIMHESFTPKKPVLDFCLEQATAGTTMSTDCNFDANKLNISSNKSESFEKTLNSNSNQTMTESTMLSDHNSTLNDSIANLSVTKPGQAQLVLDPYLEQTMTEQSMLSEHNESINVGVLNILKPAQVTRVLDPHLEQTMAKQTMLSEHNLTLNNSASNSFRVKRSPKVLKTSGADCSILSEHNSTLNASASIAVSSVQTVKILDPHLEQTMAESTMLSDHNLSVNNCVLNTSTAEQPSAANALEISGADRSILSEHNSTLNASASNSLKLEQSQSFSDPQQEPTSAERSTLSVHNSTLNASTLSCSRLEGSKITDDCLGEPEQASNKLSAIDESNSNVYFSNSLKMPMSSTFYDVHMEDIQEEYSLTENDNNETKSKFGDDKSFLIIEAEVKCHTLTAELRATEEQLREAKSWSAEKDIELRCVNQELLTFKSEIESLRATCSFLESKLKANEDEMFLRIEAEAKCESMAAELKKLQDDFSAASSKSVSKEAEMQRIERELRSSKLEVEKLGSNYADLENKLQSHEHEMFLKIETEAKCEALVNELKVAKEELNEALQLVAKHSTDLKAVEETINEERSNNKAEIETLQSKCFNLEEKLKATEEKILLKTELETKCQLLAEELKALQETRQTFSELASKRETDLNEAQQLLSEKEKEIELLTSNYSDLEAKWKINENEKQLRPEAEEKYNMLKAELKTCEEKLNTFLTAVNSADEKLKDAERELSIRKSEVHQLRAKCKDLEKKAKANEEEKRFRLESEEKCTSLLAEMKIINEELQAVSLKVEKIAAENQLLSSQKEEMEQQMIAESEEFDEIEDTLRTENFTLKRQLVQLKLRLNMISEEEACMELGFDVSKNFDK